MADYEKITLDGVVSKIRQLVPGMPFNAKGGCFLWLVLDNKGTPDECWHILSSDSPWQPLLATDNKSFGEGYFLKGEEADIEELEMVAVEMIDDLYDKFPNKLPRLLSH